MDDKTFETHVRRLFRQILFGGIDKANQEGFRVRGISDMKKLPAKGVRVFIRGCHYSFNDAQKQIARLTIEIVTEKQVIEDRFRAARGSRDAAEVEQLNGEISHLEKQTILLRRLLDCILAHFIGDQNWILRRLMLYQGIRDIDLRVLEHTVKEADERNRQDRMVFHLVTDLLSAVHVGDLIKVDRSDISKPLKPGEWEVIELKEGKVNDKLGELLDRLEDKPLAPPDLQKIEEQFGPKAVKQAERMARQRTRQIRAEELIRTDEGPEPVFGAPIRLFDMGEDYSDYFHVIQMICEHLGNEQTASGVLENCLYFTGTTKRVFDRYGLEGVAHRVLHVRDPQRECMLGRGDSNTDKEVADIADISGVVDLIEANLFSGWSRSIFNWPMPEETIYKLAFGEYRIFMWMDFQKFFEEAAEKKGILLDWVPPDMKGVKGDSRDFLAKYSDVIAGSPDSRGAWAQRRGQPRQLLMSGLFNRIYVELMTPKYLLDLIERNCDLAANGHHAESVSLPKASVIPVK